MPVKPGNPSDAVPKYSLTNTLETLYALIKEWLQFFQNYSRTVEKNLTHTIYKPLKIYNKLFPFENQFDTNNSLSYNVKLIQRTLKQLRKITGREMRYYKHDRKSSTIYGKLRHLYIICDLVIGITKGIFKEKLFHDKDLNRINNIDLSKWLKKHGVSKELVDPPSSVVKTIYDAWFAYENGDSSKPNLEAGNGIRTLALLFTAYKGHPVYLMKVSFWDVTYFQ